MVDIDVESAQEALKKFEKEFGVDKAIFIRADVTKKDEMEKAFQETINKFGFIDILLNNAGILDETIWEREVAVNIVSLRENQ